MTYRDKSQRKPLGWSPNYRDDRTWHLIIQYDGSVVSESACNPEIMTGALHKEPQGNACRTCEKIAKKLGF